MDRELSNAQIRKQNFKLILRIALIVGGIAGAFFALRYWLKPKMNRQDFRMAKVERGRVENAITASGLVVPYFEQQLNAPVATEIKLVHLKPGATVKQSDLILELDQEFVRLDYESINDELELKKNNITKLKFEYEKNLVELDYENQIKALELSSLEAKLADAKRLQAIGGATQEEVEQANLNLKIAQLEKKKLENNLNFRRKTIKSDERNLELEVLIQEKKLKELSRKLNETALKAPRQGVITWINESIGQKVAEGEPLVRIADLESFKVEASCSDRYANAVKVGLPVRVRINNTDLDGVITSILPAVENNTLAFNVDLGDASHKLLRPNLRVEVFIVADRKENVLKIQNGPAFTGAYEQPLFVVENGKAIRKFVKIGLTNLDYVEILGNTVKEGDYVIISDMRDYESVSTIELLDE